MNTTEKSLQDALGLSSYETKVYIAGLDFEEATLTELAKSAGIPRTAAYPPLQSLLRRGLVSQVKIGKRFQYRSLEPRQLPYVLEKQKTKLGEVLGELNRKLTIPSGEFSVQYFPGTHGLNVAGEIFLNESTSKLWKAFEDPIPVLEKTSEYSFDTYIERRVAKKIHGRVITPANDTSPWIKKHMENQEKALIDVVMVSRNEYPIESSLVVAGDMIMMIIAKDIPASVIIRNKHLARTFESIHDMVWDRYRPS